MAEWILVRPPPSAYLLDSAAMSRRQLGVDTTWLERTVLASATLTANLALAEPNARVAAEVAAAVEV